MNEVILYLIEIFLLIILLLIIGILLVLLWSAILLLRQFMFYISIEDRTCLKKKSSPEKNKIDRKNNINTEKTLHIVKSCAVNNIHSPKSSNNSTERGQENPSKHGTFDKKENAEDKIYNNDFNEKKLMDIIKGNVSTNITQISIVNPERINQYGYIYLFEENPTGDLGIFHKNKDIYYAIPIEEIFDYKGFTYGGIGNCFKVNREINAGKQYKIIGIKEPCKLRQDVSGKFFILKEGLLSITEINF